MGALLGVLVVFLLITVCSLLVWGLLALGATIDLAVAIITAALMGAIAGAVVAKTSE